MLMVLNAIARAQYKQALAHLIFYYFFVKMTIYFDVFNVDVFLVANFIPAFPWSASLPGTRPWSASLPGTRPW